MLIKDLFYRGRSFEEFLSWAEDAYKERMQNILNNIFLDEIVKEKINQIDHKIKILAFAESWCPDCQINLPGVSYIASLSDKIELAIVPREGNEKVMDKYKVNGKPKIPTFVIMDEEFNELGVFIELPMIIKEIISRGNEAENIVSKRKYKKGEYVKDTISDLLKIINT